jgi:hypothetical protein
VVTPGRESARYGQDCPGRRKCGYNIQVPGTFGGLLAYMMNLTWANDLKPYVEGLEGRSAEALA